MDIIDSHTHWGPSVILGIKLTTEELLRQAKTCDVDGIVIFPFPSQALNDEGINDEVLGKCQRIDRFIPYYHIPDDLRDIPSEKGFCGGKWHSVRSVRGCSGATPRIS